MTSGSAIPIPTSGRSWADQLRKQEQGWISFCHLAEHFLGEAYPQVQRETIHSLAQSFLDLMTAGTREQIATAEEQERRMKENSPLLGGVGGFGAEDSWMTSLTKRRDELEEQIRIAEGALQKLPDVGVAEICDATMILPLRNQLKDIESQISKAQELIEKGMNLDITEGQAL